MNFVADESIDQPIVVRLRQEGHTVLAVVEMEPSISDETVTADIPLALYWYGWRV
ncbi:MAG: DUF5615 family PIN-like protein [Thermoflexales bacterium]|nr:DUF5615 family PIN-like protein [Thermoflexales bacterium]